MTAPDDPSPGAQPAESTASSEPRTRIIRRAPTGPMPTIPESPTTQIPAEPVPRRMPPPRLDEPSAGTAVAACAVSIVSGWATSVVATDLIAGWWRTDRLFCIAVGFLALVFAIATIGGVIELLLRRPIGRWLIATGALVAFLTYGGIFLAGARVAWIVYPLWVLPLASILLVLHPRTKRWLSSLQ